MKSILTEELIDELYQAYLDTDGASRKEVVDKVSSEYNISPYFVYKALKKASIKRPVPKVFTPVSKPTKITPEISKIIDDEPLAVIAHMAKSIVIKIDYVVSQKYIENILRERLDPKDIIKFEPIKADKHDDLYKEFLSMPDRYDTTKFKALGKKYGASTITVRRIIDAKRGHGIINGRGQNRSLYFEKDGSILVEKGYVAPKKAKKQKEFTSNLSKKENPYGEGYFNPKQDLF